MRELPRPVLKWPGGKARLVDELLPELGRGHTYFEPCIGGGAVFFAAARARLFRRAVIGDLSPDVVATYRALRDRLPELVRALERLAPRALDPAHYYRVRAEDMADDVARAARLVYLTRTSFNGLYRVNRAGRANAPFGRHVKPRVLDVEALEAAAAALQGVEIVHGDFTVSTARARAGDVVYFDPPYVPRSASASFTAYAGAFTEADHARLVDEALRLVHRRVRVVVSSSDCPRARRLLAPLSPLRRVRVRRSIGASARSRVDVPEILAVAGPRAGLCAERRDG